MKCVEEQKALAEVQKIIDEPMETVVHRENDDDVEGDDEGQITKENVHKTIMSSFPKATGSVMYTSGDNILTCSLFGPQQMSTNANLIKRNYFRIFLYPLGKIRNMSKGLFWKWDLFPNFNHEFFRYFYEIL